MQRARHSVNATVSGIDKVNACRYNYNAMKAVERLNQEVEKISGELNDFKYKKYTATHDAHQYFEKYFGLNHPSAICL
jgi:zinc transport system substrate-binding protein